jgi:glycosyltransferase involved in cell wall biosynthesis
MHNPFFSVIMVTYNSSHFIREAIESVLASSFKNFELIIGDDCSTDNTWDIVNEYTDTRIISYQNEVNLREYPNRNKALNMSKGEWVIYIDGDDMIYSHALSFIHEMILKESNVGMLLMRWYRNDMFYPVIITPRDFYVEHFFGSGFLGSALTNVVFKRKVIIDEGGFSNSHIYGDDYIRKKIALKYNMLIILDHLTFWRETPNQASQRSKLSFKGQFEQIETDLFFLELAFKSKLLSKNEEKKARVDLTKDILRRSMKKILRLKLIESYSILRRYYSHLVIPWNITEVKSTFEDYSPMRILNFEKSKARLNK